MKPIIALFIALCWLAPSICSPNTDTRIKDSLLNIYRAAPPDSTRLEALHQLATLELSSPEFLDYEGKMLEEAITQKNIHYQSAAIYSHVAHYYDQLDREHTEQWLQKLEQLATKEKYYEHYFTGKRMLIELYIINQKSELALRLSQDMYKQAERLNDHDGMCEACQCLLTAYISSMRYKESLTYLEKAFELIGPDAPLYAQADLLTKAVLVYSYLYDNDNMLRYLKKLKAIQKDFIEEREATLASEDIHTFQLFLEVHYALYYTRAQQAEAARTHLQQADKHLDETTFLPYRLISLATHSEYCQLVKDYPQALAYLDEAIALISPIAPEDVITYSLQKADVLVKMGRADEALPLYKKTTKSKDSLYAAFSSAQIEQIQESYDIDKLIRQKAHRQAIFHNICITLSVIAITALLLFNLHIYRGRKRLQRDEKEMRKLARIAEEANESKSRFLSSVSYNIRIQLNNVVGFSQLLSTATDLSEEERKEYSGIIQNHSNKLIKLVNNVLDLSRMESNRMKYQLQDYPVQEWCDSLSYQVQMHGDGHIHLEQQIEAGDSHIHTDVNRLTQAVTSMLLYPTKCDEPRHVKMMLTYRPEAKQIVCQIENSPLADARFASQEVSIQQEINRLFFEHFEGSYQMDNGQEGTSARIIFTYPTVSPKQETPLFI